MAIVRHFISRFSVGGRCEVFVEFDDVDHLLKTVIVTGKIGRFVDVKIDGHDVDLEFRKNLPREVRTDVSAKNIRYFAPDDDVTPPDTPNIICTYYDPALTRSQIDTHKGS